MSVGSPERDPVDAGTDGGRGDLRPWGDRTPTHERLALLLRWATRAAGAALAVTLLDRRLHLVGLVGVGLLLAAPLLAMVVAVVQYARERDWSEAGLAFVLLIMLLVGAWLGRA